MLLGSGPRRMPQNGGRSNPAQRRGPVQGRYTRRPVEAVDGLRRQEEWRKRRDQSQHLTALSLRRVAGPGLPGAVRHHQDQFVSGDPVQPVADDAVAGYPHPEESWLKGTAPVSLSLAFAGRGGGEHVTLGGAVAWEVIAVLASGLFAGAAVYINVVEHPARVQCGTELAVTQFGPSYHRATFMQVALAVTGLAAGAAAWINGSGLGWLLGGVTLGSVLPFTLLVVFPTNKRLLDPSLDRRSQLASDLLSQWARLHAVRSALSLGAFVLFVCLR